MGNAVIAADSLAKSYDGKIYAVHDLTLEVPKGEVFGFLGPNGAGKTTTVKLLTGLLKPTEGSCSVLGLSPKKDWSRLHRVCGVLTETAKMYGQLTGMENLMFFGAVSGLSKPECAGRAEELLKRLDLWDAREKRLAHFSTGMAQRLSLARCLLGRPQILFLDEPTSGLDPESAQAVDALIAGLAKEEGATVFLCTHQLRYAQDLCRTYGIVEEGGLLARGTLEELRQKAGLPVRALFRLKEGDSAPELEPQDSGLWGTDLLREEDMPSIVRSLVSGGHDVYGAWIQKPSLEQVYFSLLKEGKKP